MVKIQRNGTWVLFVIFGLSAVVALFMFSGNRSGLTGNVVLGEYVDQTTCEAAGYFWYDSVCNDQAQVVDVCDATHLSLCLDEPTCTTATGFWYNSLCNAVAQPVCDATHLDLCLDEPTCTGATGIWNNSLCNAAPCVESWTCGNWTDCDGTTKTRTCTDANACGTTETKPIESESCTVCTPDWTNEDWGACSNGVKTRSPTDNNNCGIDYAGALSTDCVEGSTTSATTTTTTTTTNPTTTVPGVNVVTSATICTANQETCNNGGLYICNADGAAWSLKESCELGCVDNKCVVEESTSTSTSLSGSVVKTPTESTKQFLTDLFSNKTRMYLILGGVGVLIAGFVSYFFFFKKKMKK